MNKRKKNEWKDNNNNSKNKKKTLCTLCENTWQSHIGCNYRIGRLQYRTIDEGAWRTVTEDLFSFGFQLGNEREKRAVLLPRIGVLLIRMYSNAGKCLSFLEFIGWAENYGKTILQLLLLNGLEFDGYITTAGIHYRTYMVHEILLSLKMREKIAVKIKFY